ncbi:hypothetical protein C8J56DRAFT_889358 [Mycena floridula]|nr:hypothetical protein C8J56DRAFT_889358 [Mycena floridula]
MTPDEVALLKHAGQVLVENFSTLVASFKLMIGCLINNTDLELLERFEVADSSIQPLILAQIWINSNGNGLIFIFGDGIVVWQAWAGWSDQRSVIILPALTLLAAFGMGLCFLNVLLIYVNYQATVLTHRKFMKDTVGVGTSAAGKVLMFLTESDIVYVIFQCSREPDISAEDE